MIPALVVLAALAVAALLYALLRAASRADREEERQQARHRHPAGRFDADPIPAEEFTKGGLLG